MPSNSAQWMAEYGRPALIGLAVAVVVLLGISVWRSQKEAKAAAAVQALFQSKSPEELQMTGLGRSGGPDRPDGAGLGRGGILCAEPL